MEKLEDKLLSAASNLINGPDSFYCKQSASLTELCKSPESVIKKYAESWKQKLETELHLPYKEVIAQNPNTEQIADWLYSNAAVYLMDSLAEIGKCQKLNAKSMPNQAENLRKLMRTIDLHLYEITEALHPYYSTNSNFFRANNLMQMEMIVLLRMKNELYDTRFESPGLRGLWNLEQEPAHAQVN